VHTCWVAVTVDVTTGAVEVVVVVTVWVLV
jgi:hypothetical protein